MTISERQLEENEAKLDNILHKIVESSKQIQELRTTIDLYDEDTRDAARRTLSEIDTLAKIIENLAMLADDIDISDENITTSLETDIKGKLDEAIGKIISVKSIMQP